MEIAVALLVHIHLWFLIALLRKRNDVADIGWGLGFILLSLVQFSSHSPSPRSWIALTLVTAWGLRLSGYIFLRSRKLPEDARYREMREDWGRHWVLQTYVKVFWLQGLLMLIVSAPLLVVLGTPIDDALGIFDWTGISLALTGLGIETLADAQKWRFKKDPANRGKLMTTGLWSRSRHPNYFGEILFWFGIAFFPLSGGASALWTWIGPLLLTGLLLKVSGVPLAEKRSRQNPEFSAYAARTRLLVPLKPFRSFKPIEKKH